MSAVGPASLESSEARLDAAIKSVKLPSAKLEDDSFERLEIELNDILSNLAIQLRDEGMSQETLGALFQGRRDRLKNEQIAADLKSLLDASLTEICGRIDSGPWAKGLGLFDKEYYAQHGPLSND